MRLHFTAVSEQTSAFVPLHLGSRNSTKAGAGLTPTLLANDGKIVVISTQPLLDAHFNSANRRELTLYGNRNVTYTIQSSTNLANESFWRYRGAVFMGTNLFRTALVGDNPAPPAPAFFRLKQ